MTRAEAVAEIGHLRRYANLLRGVIRQTKDELRSVEHRIEALHEVLSLTGDEK